MYRVENPPSRPVMVYDGACRFCCKWIERLRRFLGRKADYVPYQECAERFPEIPREEFERAVQWITQEGWVYPGAEGVFRALGMRRAGWIFQFVYRSLPGLVLLADLIYQMVARNRDRLSRIDRILTGLEGVIPDYTVSCGLFLKLVALVYFVAFASLLGQITGLVGSHGILPAQQFLDNAFMREAMLAFWHYPTWLWFNCSDAALQGICVAGMVVSLAVLAGVAPIPGFVLLWTLYLSVVNVGNIFLGFQWDGLLLEAGLLCVFLAPWTWWTGRTLAVRHTALARWLVLWLLFRLMFGSGLVKLISGDVTWHHLTALQFHFETQPLPAWPAYFAHHLPVLLLKAAAAAMFGIELVVPFFIFGPRRGRLLAAGLFLLLQLLIALTGNFCFFNLLSAALCLVLVDDETWRRLGRLLRLPEGRGADSRKIRKWPGATVLPLAGLVFLMSGVQMLQLVVGAIPWPGPVVWLYESASPFRSINSYGLFAIMTTHRLEIALEGSNDGSLWLEYEFKWKPGNVRRTPGFLAPYQPRLDWQMWFAALGNCQQNPWTVHLCEQVLRGSPEVLGLLKTNPFHERPPKYVKLVVYEYHFSSLREWKSNGAWWTARLRGDYSPSLSLNR